MKIEKDQRIDKVGESEDPSDPTIFKINVKGQFRT